MVFLFPMLLTVGCEKYNQPPVSEEEEFTHKSYVEILATFAEQKKVRRLSLCKECKERKEECKILHQEVADAAEWKEQLLKFEDSK
tara:strand:+ start:1044 stop:1301 length:258 start_codon:yes stop_codon:yes gene_type:complete